MIKAFFIARSRILKPETWRTGTDFPAGAIHYKLRQSSCQPHPVMPIIHPQPENEKPERHAP
jgi:hypothetical protein